MDINFSYQLLFLLFSAKESKLKFYVLPLPLNSGCVGRFFCLFCFFFFLSLLLFTWWGFLFVFLLLVLFWNHLLLWEIRHQRVLSYLCGGGGGGGVDNT